MDHKKIQNDLDYIWNNRIGLMPQEEIINEAYELTRPLMEKIHGEIKWRINPFDKKQGLVLG